MMRRVTGRLPVSQSTTAALSAEYLTILQAEGFADITYTPNDPSVLGRYVLLARGKGTT